MGIPDYALIKGGMLVNKEPGPALILIDMQKGFDDLSFWGERNNPEAENYARELLQAWRKKGFPVFFVKHCSANPKSLLAEGQPGNEFKEEIRPKAGERVIKKKVHSAFIGTDLKERLDKAHITQLVIAGFATDHCVTTTARMAGDYGYETFVASDATAAFDRKGTEGKYFPAELIHETSLASIHREFAKVLTAKQIMEFFIKEH